NVRSENELTNKRKKIGIFLENYFDATDLALEEENHKVSSVDFAMYMIVMKHIVEMANIKVKVSKGDIDEAILYPLAGRFDDLENFSGGLINTVGAFINLVTHCERFTPKEQILKDKQKHYERLSRDTSLFSLAISSHVYQSHPNGMKWLDILALNILDSLGKTEPTSKDYFEVMMMNINMPEITLSGITKQIQDWETLYDSKKWESQYYKAHRLGICEIIKQTANQKFLKLGRPGFIYEEDTHNFELDMLYDIDNKRLLKSLKHL
ncbi:MAG: hypothetical protein KDC90_18335, partial [Ignavibacteriae bacterium]|nr:hypothetical protein [Ignavibacteriota bacterium]